MGQKKTHKLSTGYTNLCFSWFSGYTPLFWFFFLLGDKVFLRRLSPKFGKLTKSSFCVLLRRGDVRKHMQQMAPFWRQPFPAPKALQKRPCESLLHDVGIIFAPPHPPSLQISLLSLGQKEKSLLRKPDSPC